MQPREKMLATIVAALAVLAVLWLGWKRWDEAVFTRISSRTSLEQTVSKKKLQVEKGRAAQVRLTDWQKLSLPENRETARAEYKNWLLGLVERAKFTGAELTMQPSQGRRTALDRLGFQITATSTLEQLTDFLYQFYRGGYLHQIRTLQIQPAEGSRQLRLTIAIEAGALRGAKEGPRERPASDRLAWSKLDDYKQTIIKRNLFAEYTLPAPLVVQRTPPRVEPKPPSFDVAKFAFLTAVLLVDGRPQIWLNMRTTGKTLRLFEGDPFEVGMLKARVTRIGLRDAEIAVGEKRLRLALGESLREADEIRATAEASDSSRDIDERKN